jgi:hypothetical protein
MISHTSNVFLLSGEGSLEAQRPTMKNFWFGGLDAYLDTSTCSPSSTSDQLVIWLIPEDQILNRRVQEDKTHAEVYLTDSNAPSISA